MAAPTLVATQATTWNASTARSVTLTVQTNDVIAAWTGTESGGRQVVISSSGATVDAWTSRDQEGAGSSQAWARAWTANVTAGGTLTVTFTGSGGVGNFGGIVWQWRGSSGFDSAIGAAADTDGQLALTALSDNCGICYGAADWNAGSYPSRSLLAIGSTTGVEDAYFPGDGHYAVMAAHWADAGAAGAKTVGYSGASGQQSAVIALAVKGAAGGGSTPVSLTGTVSALTLAAPAGTASATSGGTPVSLTGAVAALTLAAPIGSATTVTNITDTGPATLALATPAGTVTTVQKVTLTGAVANLTTAAPAGTVAVGGAVSIGGDVAALTVAAPAGTVGTSSSGPVSLAGATAAVTIAAPQGTVTTATVVNLAGATGGITLAALAGSVNVGGGITLSGPVATVALSALAGSVAARQLVDLVGPPATVDLAAPAGAFSNPSAFRDYQILAVADRSRHVTITEHRRAVAVTDRS